MWNDQSKAADHLLAQPVSSWLIYFSLFMAFLWNVSPWPAVDWLPDLLILTVLFWNVHQPRIVNIGMAWWMGLFMDVHRATLFGEYAMSYIIMAFIVQQLHRRIVGFGLYGQLLHILPIMLIGRLTAATIHFFVTRQLSGWVVFLGCFLALGLWPILSTWVVLIQRRRSAEEQRSSV
jgi:rod shape-determining protein MreD